MTLAFDQSGFFEAIESRLRLEGISRRELSRRLGLSPSIFTRLARGKHPDVETFLKILSWLSLPAHLFIKGAKVEDSDMVAVFSESLRRDQKISKNDAEAFENIVRAVYQSFSSR